MPKKKQPEVSKKAAQKKKQQILEDKTFGMKNKNKSKKVQQQIQSIAKSVMNTGDRRQRQLEEQRTKAKKEAKARKKALEAEQNALFGEGLLAVKKKTTNMKTGKVEAKGRDADDDGDKKSTSRAMKMMYQMDAQEMEDKLREDPNYVPTLEDEIESQRQKKVAELKKQGKGTPVTPETFAIWQEKKRKRRAEEAKKLVEAEMKKKKGGKGLAILSGRALYEYKASLFEVDDEATKPLTIEETTEADEDEKPAATEQDEKPAATEEVAKVAAKVQNELFLEGDDDDLDDLDDMDDE